MKLDLETNVAFTDNHYTATFYFFKSGGIVRQDMDGNLIVVYNTGDVVFMNKDKDQYQIRKIITHNGIITQ